MIVTLLGSCQRAKNLWEMKMAVKQIVVSSLEMVPQHMGKRLCELEIILKIEFIFQPC